MSADDSDKTFFKQPMPGGDRTTMRPTPGGRSVAAGGRDIPVQAPSPAPSYSSPSSGRMPIDPI